MAAANQAKIGSGIHNRAAGDDGGGIAGSVHHMEGIRLLRSGCRALTDESQLGMEGDVHALGEIPGALGRNADAQVDHVAVL